MRLDVWVRHWNGDPSRLLDGPSMGLGGNKWNGAQIGRCEAIYEHMMKQAVQSKHSNCVVNSIFYATCLNIYSIQWSRHEPIRCSSCSLCALCPVSSRVLFFVQEREGEREREREMFICVNFRIFRSVDRVLCFAGV